MEPGSRVRPRRWNTDQTCHRRCKRQETNPDTYAARRVSQEMAPKRHISKPARNIQVIINLY